MKDYLLKIAFLSTLCFGVFTTIACSENDSDDPSNNQEQIDDGDNSIDDDSIDDDSIGDGGQDDNGDDPSNEDNPSDGGETTIELTNTCSVCPELDLEQDNSSGSANFFYPAGTVCKGKDGKAYYENGDPVDELGQTYEDHIAFLGNYARFCNPVE